MWAYRQIKAGRYGQIVHRRGLWAYVDLARVEAAEGRSFTPEQLRLAGVKPEILAIEAEFGKEIGCSGRERSVGKMFNDRSALKYTAPLL